MKRILQLVLSLGITAASFAWTFKDTKWPEMKASLVSANYLWLLPYLGILACIHVARTLRWGNLLSPLEKIPFKKLNEASGIGFMMLILLPFRLGEFARPFLIAQRSQIRRSVAMTSVVFERIVDGIIIAVLLRGLMFFVPEDAPRIDEIRLGANLMFAVFFGGFCFLVFARVKHALTLKLIRAIVGKVSPKLAEKVVYIVDGFVGALRMLPDAKNMASFVFFTTVYWVLNGWGMSLLAKAFNWQLADGTLAQVTLFQGFVVLAVLVGGMLIPAAPGSAGTFQASVVLALALFFPKDTVSSTGVAYANVLWLVQILQQVLVGVALLVLSNTSFTAVAGKLGDEQPST